MGRSFSSVVGTSSNDDEGDTLLEDTEQVEGNEEIDTKETASGDDDEDDGTGEGEEGAEGEEGEEEEEEEEEEGEEDTQVDSQMSPEHGDYMKPQRIMAELERHIVGQHDAKRAVAVALRNRWRRQRLEAEHRDEISPKNILMVGPTGCGKTEIARRLAKLARAPFIKVEATKYTEVGFHGRDVDTIIRDLVEAAIILVKKNKMEDLRPQVTQAVERQIIDALVGSTAKADSRESFLMLLRDGQLEEYTFEMDIPVVNKGGQGSAGGISFFPAVDPSANQGMALSDMLQKLGSKGPRKVEKRKLKVKEARPLLMDAELERLIEELDIPQEAVNLVEESGIVFIDEIDKICSNGDRRSGADASDEGVQRDLLPLIEGCSVQTKHGNVQTDHILFVCSGAFHNCKPSDIVPELQGRLPIRVELQALGQEDLLRILKEPELNLIRQQQLMLATEGVDLRFTDEAIAEIANLAFEINTSVENIGARRLHTVVERIVEDISFEAAEMKSGTILEVDEALVRERVGILLQKADLSKFVL